MSVQLEHQVKAEATFLGFLKRQYFETAPDFPSTLDLTGQVGIVTGSNVGLGLACARHLLSLKLTHLILAVRSQAKGDAAARGMHVEFPEAKIEVCLLDLESYVSVRKFVEHCTAIGRIDIAILNAGLAMKHFKVAKETKHEITLQVNYLSTALLAILLLPLLRPRPEKPLPGHMTFVGSDTAYGARLDNGQYPSILASFDAPGTYKGFEQYTASKLLLIAFVASLAAETSVEQVTINICWPGLCKSTQIMRKPDGHWATRLAVKLIGKSVAAGAKGIVYAAVAKGEISHGSVVSEGLIKPFPAVLYGKSGEEQRNRLWKETVKEFHTTDVSGILHGKI